MDGYTYLFLQTLPIVSAVALVFCLMGLFFGASKYRTQLRETEQAREQLAGEVEKLRKGQDGIRGELDAAKVELRQARMQGMTVTGGGVKLPAATSAAKLIGGADIDLGEVYDVAPEQVDDLKKVRGIAGVMEKKLNGVGIYTFAQIARWSDEAAAEFGVRLGIIGNISRYHWRQQCARLHKEKYGEVV